MGKDLLTFFGLLLGSQVLSSFFKGCFSFPFFVFFVGRLLNTDSQ